MNATEKGKSKMDDTKRGITVVLMGDFFEAFGEEAAVVSRVCGLTLTKRRDGTPMCGFPKHSATDRVAELVSAGYTVMVMPAPAKFQPGDPVVFTNDYGVVFEGKTIVRLDPQPFDGSVRYFYEPSDSPWFSVKEKSLSPQREPAAVMTGDRLPAEDQRYVRSCYVHRYTRDHKPAWSTKPMPDGRKYPVQFASDLDWLAHTEFAVTKSGRLDRKAVYCKSNPTWPDGRLEPVAMELTP